MPDILELLQQLPSLPGDSNGQLPAPPAAQAPASATPVGPQAKAQGPDILSLLAGAMQPSTPAAKPQPAEADMANLTPIALLQFAQAVTRPKMRGESLMGVGLDAAAQAATGYMNNKKQLEDRAMQQEVQKRQLAAADQQLQASRVAMVGDVARIKGQEATRPLELKSLELAIQKATGDVELQGIQKRLALLNEKYAEQEKQAGLEERAAKTAEAKADAAMKQAHAQLYQRQTEEMLNMIREKAAASQRPDYHVVPGLPGEPQTVLDKRTGSTFIQPMAPSDALAYAKRQIKADREMGNIKTDAEEKAAVKKMYDKLVSGTMPAPQQPQGPGMPAAPTGAQPPAQGAGPNATAGNPKYAEMDPDVQTLILRTQSYPKATGAAAAKDGKVYVIEGGHIKEILPNVDSFYSKYSVDSNGGLQLKAGQSTPAGASAPASASSAPAGTSSGIEAQFQREDNEMQSGRRRTYSPEVQKWINEQSAARKKSFDQGDAEYMAREQRRMLRKDY